MFSAQYPDHPRKRFREDEEVAPGGPVGFTEHRSKRLQSLPLRTSPNSKRWVDRPNFPLPNPTFAATASHAQAVTPQEPLQEHMWADEPELVSVSHPAGMDAGIFDSDMDMMDASGPGGGLHEPDPHGYQHGIEQGAYEPDQAVPSVTGRIPTPIHCSFAAQVRGNNWNGAAVGHGDVLATTPEEPNASAFSHHGLSSQQAMEATVTPIMADWSVVQNRRLPSPISECGAEDSQSSASGKMALDLASSFPSSGGGHMNHVTHEHPLVVGLPPRASSAMGGRSSTPGGAAREGTPGLEMDVESSAGGGGTPSPKKGHTRSKHTLNSWTGLQPGMTRSFSIGYRADCEKCRMKMPGHFNHIIIS
ncbi:hypothetical protein C8A05DRAFT_32276 [Staphylotrichum tortipilum]|uniref:Uncharacterized protein n=1 Tax=Staphylotrichum tortipilum TaxID=2831512 RepID=A0AAN6RUZ9_9PEZI|nr:hypothetical protein C8A05DRAFT_32276 [Staphylotrichum longicolle]